MPALNPLTGLGGLNQFGGAPISQPVIAYSGADSGAVVVQTVTGSTSVSGPTSYTLTFATSQPGTTLVAFVAVNASSSSATGVPPTGWTQVSLSTQSTITLGGFAYFNNPGGITTFTLSAPVATAGGIAGVGYEIANCPFISDTNQINNATGTAVTSGGSQLVPPATNNLVLGAVAWVLGTATLAVGNTVPAGTISTNSGQVSSTVGATNAAIQAALLRQPAQAATVSTGFLVGGTLSVSSAWDAVAFNLRSLASDYSAGSQQVDQTRQGPQVIGGGQQAICVGTL